ncbi:MAG: hypothetical protein R2882_04205 [Gemmatimonadales bacterium]
MRYNPAMLRYVGQDGDKEAATARNADARTGRASVVTVNLNTRVFPRRTAVLNFEVIGYNYRAPSATSFPPRPTPGTTPSTSGRRSAA